jgi:hypothetical protein
MQFLLKRLGIGQPEPLELEYERRHGRLLAAQAALKRVEEMHHANLLSLATWKKIEPELRKQVADALKAQTELLDEHSGLQAEEHEDAKLEGLRAQRAALATMLSNGLLSDAVFEELVTEVDESIAGTHRHSSMKPEEPTTI